MAAYAALVSIMQTIHQIEHHPSPPISMDKTQVETITDIVMFLQEFLEGYKSPFADGDKADPLEMRIADAVYAAEDVIECHILDQIHPSVLVLYEALSKVLKVMDRIVKIKEGELLKEVSDSSTFDYMYEILVDLTLDIQFIEERGKEDMDLIFALKGHLQRQVSNSSADLYKTVVKVIEHVDLIKNELTVIFAFKDQLQRQVSIYTDSSTLADLYETHVDIRENMDSDLIKKNVMEIIAVKDQLEIQVSVSSDSSTSADFHESLQKVIEEMDLIKKEVMEVVALKDHRQVSGGSSTSSFSKPNSTTMVGFDDVMLQLMEKLVYGEQNRQVIPIVGMGGIGKTTLAINVYAHPSISHRFDICAWITISQQYNTKELLREILSQVGKKGLSQMSEEDEIGLALHKCLTNRRYLIVLDDMWSIEAWDVIQRYLPDNSNGSRIMVSTRISNLGSKLDNSYVLEMKFMNDESSWNVFCKIVFGRKRCPSELEKIGKKIVEYCRGLPLSIVVMGGLVEKLEQTEECWKSIRRSLNSLVNLENDMHCLKILKLSYNHLPVYLKPCFLYLGMFEEDSKIRASMVIKLWVSEGFLKPVSGKSLETIAKEYLDELVDRNLILVHELGSTGNMKYFKIHDLLRDLCLREAENERFYDVVGQHSPQGTCSQRRVAILGSTSKEKVVDAMKSRPYARTCISDRERVQLLPNLKLLRTLRLYDDDYIAEHSLGKLFELVNLRLLVVRSDGHSSHVPSNMNLLWSLQTLIVYSSQLIVNAPVEIWNMSQLRHVKVRLEPWYLPAPPPSDNIVIMENLQTLKGVMNFKCDEMMVRRIPNIKKLGLVFLKDKGTESRDDHIYAQNIKRLKKLESLTYQGYPSGAFLRKLTFPHSLRNLTLSMAEGSGMEVILEKVSTLPLLQKLKLYGGYFTTGKWETVEGQFLSLKILSLSCLHLEWWTMESSHFPCLKHLQLSCLRDLKEIPAELGDIPTLKSVALNNCCASVVKSAKRMVEEQEDLQGEDQLSFKVTVWLAGKDVDDELGLETPNFVVIKY